MPDIRRMGDDFVMLINGRLVRSWCIDELVELWEHRNDDDDDE